MSEETTTPETEETTPATTEETTGGEGILDDVEPVTPDESGVETATAKENDPERPPWLPEKFKKPEDMVQSYKELETRLAEGPKPPETYEVTDPDGQPVELSEHDVEVMKEAKLTNDQAQAMVQYFHDIVVPELTQAQAEVQKANLANEWNVQADSEQFMRRLGQVKAWANQNLPEDVVKELSRSATGVNSIYKMMETGFKATQVNGQTTQGRPDRSELQKLMDDPRYWTDDTYKNEVRKKFQEAFD